jgi:arylsulfatase A-like enzyme
MRRLVRSFLLLAVLSVPPLAQAATAPRAAATRPAVRPNIVLIVTDDEDWRVHEFMPRTRRLLHEQGATFSNYFVSYSLCCPSRSSILRGQYPLNTGVLGNHPPDGGFDAFLAAGDESSTIATWLQGAGYYTAMVGKYLNGYGRSKKGGAKHVPPGWSDWHALLQERYFDYAISGNGKAEHYGHEHRDYSTDVLRDLALRAVRTAAGRNQPLFLYLAPKGPHLPSEPAPRHAAMFSDAEMPRGASFDEADVSDKPEPVRERSRVSPFAAYYMEMIYRNRLRTMQSVDEMVEAVVEELRANGTLDRTYVFYSSDNGWHMGEHRLGPGKNTPYEEDIRVPLLVRGPGVPPGSVIQSMVVNIDLAPTIAELAGVAPPPWVDGRSIVPLWKGDTRNWRKCLLVQRGKNPELQADEGDDSHTPFGFHALRTEQYLYAQWTNGERELYDVIADQAELRNLSRSADPGLVSLLAGRMDALSACKGADCRRLESAPLAVARPATH